MKHANGSSNANADRRQLDEDGENGVSVKGCATSLLVGLLAVALWAVVLAAAVGAWRLMAEFLIE